MNKKTLGSRSSRPSGPIPRFEQDHDALASPPSDGEEALPTIRDVARHAGVSAGTVSNVLNRPSYVSNAARERVEASFRELGYRPKRRARRFRPGRVRTLGMVLVDLASPFFVDLALAADRMSRELGCSLVMCTSGEDTQLEEYNLDVLVQQRVQGVLIAPVDENNPRLEAMLERGVPVVFIDRTPTIDKCCSVATDDVLGGRLAGSHLVELGHRRLAFIGDPDARPQIAARLKGFADASAGCSIEVVKERDWSLPTGRRVGRSLVGRSAETLPTAVFCANDSLALGLMHELLAGGIRVPEDVAIVGYDDIMWAEGAAVPLTTIRQQSAELGRTAIRLVLADADDGQRHRHEHVLLEPQLVVRDSTSVPRPVKVPA